MTKKTKKNQADVVPLFGRDEMNLIEIPFGPITPGQTKSFHIKHEVYDKQLRRYVTRKLQITGAEAYGLPRPIDDLVLMGMKALTCEAGFESKRVEFSAYQLLKTIRWPDDGRSYKRLEESFDRILGTNLKFKDFWWDKGDQEWKSRAFHLIEEYELCSRSRLDRSRKGEGSSKLCHFVWSDTIWKSFTDGYIRRINMEMLHRVSSGRRKEVAVRLFRVLDKRFYGGKKVVNFKLKRLCKGILGLSQNYSPSEMQRVLTRSANWLIECGFISEFEIRMRKEGDELEVVFRKGIATNQLPKPQLQPVENSSKLMAQFHALSKEKQNSLLGKAIDFCKVSNPGKYEGFCRTKDSGKNVHQKYLEMILAEYLKSNGLAA